MDTFGQEVKAQHAAKRFWTDYVPIEKMTLVMAVFAVIYSVITGGLYFIATRQLDGMKKDQRPWVRVETQVVIPSPASTMPDKTPALSVPLHILNVGKTPAKYIHADFFVENVKNGNQPLLNKSSRFVQFTTGVLFPNVPADFPATYTLLQSDWEDYREGRSFLVIYSHIAYKDLFQTEHWTDFCVFSSPKAGAYSAEKCTDFSNTDDN